MNRIQKSTTYDNLPGPGPRRNDSPPKSHDGAAHLPFLSIGSRLGLILGSGFLLTSALSGQATEYPLYAAKSILVGNIDVSHAGDQLTVTYTITEPGWAIVKSHLQVGDDSVDFHLKNGNPSPGLFTHSADHEPGVTTCTYGPIDISGLASPLLIAAHADVEYLTNTNGFANLASNGSFEDGVYEGVYAEFGYAYLTGGSGTGSIADWSLDGTIQWLDNRGSWTWWLYPTEGYRIVSLKAVGDPVVPASLSQAIPTVAGKSYQVGFDLSSNQDVPGEKGLFVSADTDTVYFSSSASFNDWTRETFRFTASDTSTLLEFLSADDVEWWGVAIDNVTVEAIDHDGAWGGDIPFPGKNWATYFEYTPAP